MAYVFKFTICIIPIFRPCDMTIRMKCPLTYVYHVNILVSNTFDGKGGSKYARLDLDFDRRRNYYWYFTCYKKSADKKVAKGYMGY